MFDRIISILEGLFTRGAGAVATMLIPVIIVRAYGSEALAEFSVIVAVSSVAAPLMAVGTATLIVRASDSTGSVAAPAMVAVLDTRPWFFLSSLFVAMVLVLSPIWAGTDQTLVQSAWIVLISFATASLARNNAYARAQDRLRDIFWIEGLVRPISSLFFLVIAVAVNYGTDAPILTHATSIIIAIAILRLRETNHQDQTQIAIAKKSKTPARWRLISQELLGVTLLMAGYRLMQNIDILLLAKNNTPMIVGNYRAIWVVASGVSMALLIIPVVYQGKFLQKKNSLASFLRACDSLKEAYFMGLVAASASASVIYFFKSEIFSAAYSSNIPLDSELLFLLLVSHAIFGLMSIAITFFIMAKMDAALLRLYIIFLPLMFFLGDIYVQHSGPEGAVVTMLLGCSLIFVLLNYFIWEERQKLIRKDLGCK